MVLKNTQIDQKCPASFVVGAKLYVLYVSRQVTRVLQQNKERHRHRTEIPKTCVTNLLRISH